MTQIIYWSSTCITLGVVTIFYPEEILTTKKGYQKVMTINYCNISINSDCFKIVFSRNTSHLEMKNSMFFSLQREKERRTVFVHT